MADRGLRQVVQAICAVCLAASVLAGCGAGGHDLAPQEGDEGTVTVKDAYGEVTVPVTDERIVALDPSVAAELLAIGVTPVQVGRNVFAADSAGQFREDLLGEEGAEIVDGYSLESILQAEPDLIVGLQAPRSDELIDELKTIAPVLVVEATASWKNSLNLLAEATGRIEQARAVSEYVDQQISITRTELVRAGFSGEAVSLISSCGPGEYCVYGNGRAAGDVLSRLGLEQNRDHDRNSADSDYGFSKVSEERLSEFSAPIIFIYVGSAHFGSRSPVESPVFDVSDSRCAEVDFSAWFGVGAFDSLWILNDIRAVVLGEGEVAGKDAADSIFDQMRRQ